MLIFFIIILIIIRSLFAHIEALFQSSNSKHILTNYITYHTHIQNNQHTCNCQQIAVVDVGGADDCLPLSSAVYLQTPHMDHCLTVTQTSMN